MVQNANLVYDVEYLLPVNLRLVLFYGCREVIQNVSANQSSGQRFWFSDRQKKKHKHIMQPPVMFRKIAFSGFLEVKHLKKNPL